MLPTDKAFHGRQSVEVDGNVYYRSYRIERKGKYRLRIRVISINSEYDQGIAFTFSRTPRFIGTLFLNGQKFVPDKRQQHYVVPIAYPEKNELVMDLDVLEGYFVLANASDCLDDYPALIDRISQQTGRSRDQFRGNSYTSGFTASNLYGNAFWIEALSENRYRFHCNDHRMDDDFDDLIFDLEIQSFSAE